jgi:hypothetical protein
MWLGACASLGSVAFVAAEGSHPSVQSNHNAGSGFMICSALLQHDVRQRPKALPLSPALAGPIPV